MKPSFNFIHDTKTILYKKDSKKLLFLLILTIILSLIEIIGIAAVIPFLSLSLKPELVFEKDYYFFFYEYFSFDNPTTFIIGLGCALVLFYIFRALFNVYYTYEVSSFHFQKYKELSSQLYKKYINLSYLDFTKLNSSYLIKSIVVEAREFTSLLESLILIFSETLVFLAVLLLFFIIDPKTTLILLSFLLIMTFIIGKNIFPVIKNQGQIRAQNQELFFESVNKSLNNFKLFKFNKNVNNSIDEFNDYSYKFAKSNVINSILSGLPRHIMEGLAFTVVVGLTIIILYSGKAIQGALNLEILLIYVLGLYRLMPSINRILNGYNSALFHSSSLPIINKSLEYSEENYNKNILSFQSYIELKNLSFMYENAPVFTDVNFKINKGSKVAFLGDSGSGKTTLVDIIIGLIRPESGRVLIDDISLDSSNILSWRYKVGYVPQEIYLFDGTVGENIAFNKKYNPNKVEEALKLAKVFDVVTERGGIKTLVGEKGVLFSGGQKQRIGIARALYNSPELIVFDEATSALDEKTESEIMNEIYQLDITALIISHKFKMVRLCDRIFSVNNKSVTEIFD